MTESSKELTLKSSRSSLYTVDESHVGLVHLLQENEGDDRVGAQPEKSINNFPEIRQRATNGKSINKCARVD
jgi:hypothetical protein